ncbi:MAG TPA: MFS transporter, partial [Beijerinckiaceae bacterium]|nr:MFS transporter [Beijerinckiaceae bacterium]
CLWILAAGLFASAVSPTLPSLFAVRFCSGLAAGGVIPACMASLGDRFAGPQRSLAIARFVMVGLIAQILSASFSGMIASQLSWRSVFFVSAAIASASAIIATLFLRTPAGPRTKFSVQAAADNYRSVFANPRAPLCFGTVFLEGIALFGITPFVAEILRLRGLGGAPQAGMIIGCLGIGGIIYSFMLPALLKRFSKFALLGAGGAIAAAAPAALIFLPYWPAVAAGFAVGGFGYMLMHNSIQSEAVELAPKSRVSAYSMHAFSFFAGQSLGPLVAGLWFRNFGPTVMLAISAAILACTGFVMSQGFIRLAKIAPERSAASNQGP